MRSYNRRETVNMPLEEIFDSDFQHTSLSPG